MPGMGSSRRGTPPAVRQKRGIQWVSPGRGNESANHLKNKLKDAVDEKLKSLKIRSVSISSMGGEDSDHGQRRKPDVPARQFPANRQGDQDPEHRAENTREIPNKIAVEGHTDSLPFKGDQTTNWELSTSRASAARRELEKYGIDPGRIARVVGYADQDLYIKDNPKDPRNRRISIIILPAPQDRIPFSEETGIKTIPNQIPLIVPQQSIRSGPLPSKN